MGYADMDTRTADSTSTEGPKICAECRHCQDDGEYKCIRNARSRLNVVTGEDEWVEGVLDCESEREPGLMIPSRRCGYEGNWWEAEIVCEDTLGGTRMADNYTDKE